MNKFLGISFNDELGIDEVVTKVITEDSMFIVTPNVDHVVSFHDVSDARYKESIAKANLVLCDSNIIRLLSQISPGRKISNVIPGSDLTSSLICSNGSKIGRVVIIGGSEGDKVHLTHQYEVNIVKQIVPSFGFIKSESEVNRIIDQILEVEFDVMFLCVGSPQQEILASRVFSIKPSGTLICVGASLDFIMGREARAPKFFRKLSLEWFYRLIVNPRKMFLRYLVRDMKVFGIWASEMLRVKK